MAISFPTGMPEKHCIANFRWQEKLKIWLCAIGVWKVFVQCAHVNVIRCLLYVISATMPWKLADTEIEKITQ